MKRMGLILLLCGMVGLSGCASEAPSGPQQCTDPLAGYTPFTVSVGSVDTKDLYKPILTTCDIAYKFGQTPGALIKTYTSRRFVGQGAGYAGNLTFTVTKASAVEKDLPLEDGIVGAMQLAPQKELRVSVEITMDLSGQPNLTPGHATFTAERAQALPMTASIAQREEASHTMVLEIVHELDGQIVRALQDNYHVIGAGAVAPTVDTRPKPTADELGLPRFPDSPYHS